MIADQNSKNGPDEIPSRHEFEQVLKRAKESGDPEAIEQLRQMLDENPQIWASVGDMGAHAELTLIRVIANGDMLLEESLQRQAADMRASLARPDASALEKLTIQRIVTAWLEQTHLQVAFPADTGADMLPEARFRNQLRNSADRRFDAALRSLALVRDKLSHFQTPLDKEDNPLKIYRPTASGE